MRRQKWVWNGWGAAVWQTLVGLALTLAILAVVLGFLGWLHPMGDLAAVGRAHAVVAVLLLGIIAALSGLRLAAFWAILFALVAGAPLMLAMVFPGPPGTFTLYQKNLRFDNPSLPALVEDIRTADPLVVTLQEVSTANLPILDDLADRWPHQLLCPGGGVGGPAVASRLPPVPGATVCAEGLAAMQVLDEDQPVWVVSIHLHWPWPYRQPSHARALREVLAGLDGPVLMAGDFNMVPWGYSVQTLAQTARVVPAGPSGGTYLGFGPLVPLPIDHAMAPNGGRIELRPALGSDHLGLLARLAL